MATQTTNLHLKKPATTDTASIADINDNMDILDAALAFDNKNATLAWGAAKTLATLGANNNITVTMPSNPNSWRGFTTREFTQAYSNVAAGTTKDCDFSIGVSGYTPVAFLRVESGNQSALLTRFNISGSGANVRFKNTYSAAISGNVTITVLYLQNG